MQVDVTPVEDCDAALVALEIDTGGTAIISTIAAIQPRNGFGHIAMLLMRTA
jgi:hypothetical protein